MDEERNLIKWGQWAVIASSIAAVVSLLLFGYQLYIDRPCLKINFNGAAFTDYQDIKNAYIAVWIEAFNEGKRPIGIMESKLYIKFWDNTKFEFKEIPVFPRFDLKNAFNFPAIERPFFYEPAYYEKFVKDKSGREIPFDYHPKTLQRTEIVFDTGTYHRGFMVFKLDLENREKFLHDVKRNTLDLILLTTNNRRIININEINRWKQETFGKRFFIIKAENSNDEKKNSINE